jgi:ribosome biogenesis GTPase
VAPLHTSDSIPLNFEAQVIAAYGRHLKLRDADGVLRDARPFGRKLQVVCGDRVRCASDPRHDEVHVLEVLPRRGTLWRSTLRGGAEPVVAQLTQLIAVLAPLPKPDPFVIDRYLCAASSAAIDAIVVLNKSEIEVDADLQSLLDAYTAAGYRALRCSTHARSGLEDLRAALIGQTSAFVGQSGVGKSSLIAALLPQLSITTGELDRDAEGRHTTTASQLYDLPEGGALIDSPGVRDFAPAIETLEARSLGFPEVDRLALQCRFHDCEHLREPGCAVRSAVDAGAFDARRYESYRRLRRLYQDLRAKQGPGKR